MIRLKYADRMYWVRTDYKDRHTPMKLGFKWSRSRRLFYTLDPIVAQPLIEYAHDEATAKNLQNEISRVQREMARSKATDSNIDFPKPDGLEYMNFQKAGIEFCVDRDAVLIADEMGLGKTIQAIGYMNYTGLRHGRTLIICPASVKLNWRNELLKWLVDFTPIGVAYGNQPFPDYPIVIINWDILTRFQVEIHGEDWGLLVADECHYAKNPDSQRTKETVGTYGRKPQPGIPAKKKIFMTGTPIINRPVEMFPVLHYLDPKAWPSYWKYVMRYCNAYQGTMGWDVTGASHLKELKQKLRSTLMVRRLKKDVLKELPDKIRQVIEIPATGKLAKAVKTEQKRMKKYKDQVKELDAGYIGDFAEIALIRHETALAKVSAVVAYVKDILATDQKVVLFAWHRDVIQQLRIAFPDTAVVVTGATALSMREAAVKDFQENPTCKIFIGNIAAAGIGITLTAASQVVFAELDWTPGRMSQAEDRCHRIGQENAVNVQHLVLEGSIDAYMAQTLVEKQDIIDQALDGREGEDEDREFHYSDLLKIFDNY